MTENPSTTQNGESRVEQTEQKINIDPKIQSLIPPLKPDELSKLRESISAEGCRDPLVVWKDHTVLLDGHNRYAICQELGKSFSVLEKEFPDEDHAMLWVLKNQFGRRNLSPTQFRFMVGREYELEKKVSWGGDRKSDAVIENQLPQSEGDDSPRETAERLAKEHNISRSTVERSADLYKALEIIRDVAPNFAQRVESEKIKVPKKDILTLVKALQHSTPEQQEQIVSALKNDSRKAIDMAKEITAQSKQENHSSISEVPNDDHVGDIITYAQAAPTESDSDLDILLKLADRICCPRCDINARTALKWSCCGHSLVEAANLQEDVENDDIIPADSPHCQVEEQRCENEEHAGTSTSDCTQNGRKPYHEMAAWIPPDNSSHEASAITWAMCCMLRKGEAPRADSLAKMKNLPEQTVRAYLENASWVRKDDSSPDGIVEYLPREPSPLDKASVP